MSKLYVIEWRNKSKGKPRFTPDDGMVNMTRKQAVSLVRDYRDRFQNEGLEYRIGVYRRVRILPVPPFVRCDYAKGGGGRTCYLPRGHKERGHLFECGR